MDTTVVIPTYNERENIGPLIDALLALGIPNLSLLVVDDSSPDGTADVVRARAAHAPRVRLLARPKKEGLGRAYSAAFRHLLGSSRNHAALGSLALRPDAIIQMDADFSHNPADVPRLLAALTDAAVAVGSRYVPGGNTKNWTLPRRALSRGANIYARMLTGVPVADLTGGFSAWRSSLLRAIQSPPIHTEGYGYQIELKCRAARAGASMVEIPITFVERRVGQSKLSRRIIWEAAGVVLKLAFSPKSKVQSA